MTESRFTALLHKLSGLMLSREAYFELIQERIANNEAEFNTLISIFPDIKELFCESAELDQKPLAGLPIVVKDTIKTKGMKTTAGSKKFENFEPDYDAPIVRNIRKHGGVILGKSNTPEFANDYQTFNELNGYTSNPHDPALTSGGSSGGSAAAIALGYTEMAIGTDLGGSLRTPASYCGIYSLRPTFGAVDSTGHVPELTRNYMTTVGPMGSSIEAVARLFAAMQDLTYQAIKYQDNITLRIAPALDQIPVQVEIKSTIKKWTNQLKENGVETVEFSSFPQQELVDSVYIGFYRYFMNQPIRKPIEYYLEQQKQCQLLLDGLLEDVDGLVLPVSSIQPYRHNLSHENFVINGEEMNYWLANGQYSRLSSVTGYPSLVIPIDEIDGIPVGVQILGSRNEDTSLLDMGNTIETKFGIKYLKSV